MSESRDLLNTVTASIKFQIESNFIAPKASAEGACILSKMSYCYEVWLVTVVVVCLVTVMM